jgi:hypothetical protein
MAITFGAKPKLLFIFRRWVVLMAALASTAALFVRSRAFFRMLRRGHVPSRGIVRYATLRLMVSLSLTAVSIFAIQLV